LISGIPGNRSLKYFDSITGTEEQAVQFAGIVPTVHFSGGRKSIPRRIALGALPSGSAAPNGASELAALPPL